MPEWTEEQQEAIEARNNNLLVAAAAGSGKTAVLVERIIQLLLKDKVDIDRMLVVTFTHAAAGEMRERISATLLAELDKQDENQENLRTQINLLNRASISTIHSFCQDILRRYFHLIEIDPHFRVGDSSETSIMKLEAMEEMLEREYEQACPTFLRLVEMFGGGKNDSPLQDLVLKSYEFIQSKPEPLAWLEDRVNDYKMEADEFTQSAWMQNLEQQLRMELSGARELLQAALQITELPQGPDTYRSAINADLNMVEELGQALSRGLDAFYEQLSQVDYPRLPRVAKDTRPLLQEECKSLRDQGKKIINVLCSEILYQPPEEFRRELNELYPALAYLHQLVKLFSFTYREKKTEKGIVDFNDLEHYALEVLAHEEVAREYQSRYDYIFVDEYQDSNLVQETIINRIKREANLFLVGDVKQSIYRFRLADPGLFMHKYHNFQEGSGVLNRRIDLCMNFRSRAEIIYAVNLIFESIMSREWSEIDYDEKARLNPGIHCTLDEGGDSGSIPLELLLIEKGAAPSGTTDDMDEEQDQAGDTEVEAQVVAQRINELYGRSFYDSKLGHCRPLDYRDIVVLMRATRQAADVFSETLITAGIPVYVDADKGYFQTLEINIFLNLLKVIDNKRQDLPLLSILRSPIGRFSIDDLIAIRVCSRAESYYEALEEYLLSHNDDLQGRLQQFIDKIDTWKEEARFSKMDEFIWKLLLQTGYYYYVGAMPGGLQRQANLRILFDRAGQFQTTSLKGLFHFIKFIDKMQAGSGDMGVAKILGENDNVVRIMSIHKSKGLEFPVVIIAGLGRSFNRRDSSAPILFHKDLGLGSKFINPDLRVSRNTIARIVMKKRISMENLAEEMRILYVACTRPRDRLIMIGARRGLPAIAGKWNQAISPFQLARANCHLDWIGPVVMRHPDGGGIRELAGLEETSTEMSTDRHRWQVRIINRSGGLRAESAKQEANIIRDLLHNNKILPESQEREIVWDRLNWQYFFNEAAKIPSKVSVSDVKNIRISDHDGTAVGKVRLDKYPRFLSPESALEEQTVFSPAAKGSILHFVMQHLDFQRVGSKKEIVDQLTTMVQREMLRADEAAVVDTEKILKFFESELGQRVVKSDGVYRETPFNLLCTASEIFGDLQESQEKLLVQGVIDLYFHEEQGLVLVDYKTDRIVPGKTEEVVDKYRVQLELYRVALEKILAQRVKDTYIYLFDIDEEYKL